MHEKPEGSARRIVIPIVSFVIAILLYVLPKVLTGTDVDVVRAMDILSVLLTFSTILSLGFFEFVGQNKREHKNIEKRLDVFSGDFTPQNYSPSGNIPNPSFNAVIREEMCKLRCHYFYFSNRSFYIVWRMHNYPIDKRTSIFTIALPDLCEEKVFMAAADNWIASKKPTGNIPEIKHKRTILAKIDTFKSIYYMRRLIEEGLNITILIHSETPFIRFELTDNIIAMSFLPMTSGGAYPSTIIYSKGSLNWNAFNAYSEQIAAGSTQRLKSADEIDKYLKENFDSIQSEVRCDFPKYIELLKADYSELINRELL